VSAIRPDDDLTTELRRQIVAGILALPIAWEPTGDGEIPYRAEVDGRAHRIRVNDFPAEPLYTLLVDGEVLADLEDWPVAWVKPPIAGASPGRGRRAGR
jgi:hypothetical protein